MMQLGLEIHHRGLMQAISQGPAVLRKHMNMAVLRTVMEIARSARRYAPKAFSTLTQSINYRMVNALTGEVAPHVDYAEMVETGTGPGGFPTDEAIFQWIKVKRIQPRDPGMDQRDLAYVLARSIALKGTPEQPYMEPALQDNKARADRRINTAINKALKEMQA
jgi:HK97 gp10 family phage protein